MLFCMITLFTKFASCLFFTITQSLLGSLSSWTMMDVIGPSRLTYLMDKFVEKYKEGSTSDSSSHSSLQMSRFPIKCCL